jgi:uncharacterized protein (TIGR02145 family)
MANIDTYGALYNRYAVIDARNITASGWRVPEEADWFTLWTYLSTNRGGKLKTTGTTYWNSPNTGAVDSVGFSARGSGWRDFADGSFDALKITAVFWMADDYGGNGLGAVLFYDNANLTVSAVYDPHAGLSVRPIKNTTNLEDGQFGTYIGNDGTEYLTVCIGTQEWLAENLRETKYRSGANIPVVTSASIWAGLTTGAYTAYENDGVTDTGEDPETPATYGSRFHMPFISGLDKQYTALIKELNYEGTSEEITGAIIPAAHEVKGENDVLEDKILRSTFKLSLDCSVDGQFRDLFTHNWKKYVIEIYKNSVLYWIGFLTTDYYSEPWTAPPYTVVVEAHDGLGQLKNVDFLNTLNEPFTGKMTLAEIIGQCLHKILPFTSLYEGINIIEAHQDPADSLLTHIALQSERFYKEGNMNCYDVLHEVLKICNAQIFQQESIWWIVSIGNRGGQFTRHRMAIVSTYTAGILSMAWSVDSTDTYNPLETIDGPTGDLYWWETPKLTKLPAWKQVTVRQDLGLKESMFNPADFTVLGTPDYEVFQAGDEVSFTYFESPRRGNFIFDEYTVVIRDIPGSGNGVRFNLGYFESVPEQKFNFNFDMTNRVKLLRDEDASIIYFRCILINGGTTYYLHNTGVWNTVSDNVFAVTLFNHKIVSALIDEVTSDELPADGFVYLDILPQGGVSPAALAILLNMSAIKLTMTGFSIPESFDMTTHIDNDQNYIPDDHEMMFGDFVDVENNVRMYNGGLWYVAGVGSYGVTIDWRTTQNAEEKPLVNVIADEMAALHAYATWMISGQLRGNIKPAQTFYDAHAERRFIAKRFAANLYDDEYDVDLIEIARDEMILVTEGGTEIVTEDSDNFGI